MNVLLVEDDIQLNKTIKSFLELKTFNVLSCLDGEDALSFIEEKSFDFYIIDINIPNINGLDITKFIRRKDTKTPILIITASAEIDNFLIAHENGCNEYIKKPFHLKELEVRINKLLDVSHNEFENLAKGVKFHVEFEELWIEEEKIKLRKKEQRLLSILVQNLNHIVKNGVVTDYVWENEIKESYPLRQLVNELRKKLRNHSELIQTEIGIGYSMNSK